MPFRRKAVFKTDTFRISLNPIWKRNIIISLSWKGFYFVFLQTLVAVDFYFKYERGEKQSRMTHRLRGLQPAGSATGSRVPPVRIFSKPLAGQPTNCSPRWWRVLGRRRRAISARLSEDQLLDQATFLRGAIQRETCWRFLGSTLMRKGRHSAFSAGLLGWERDGGLQDHHPHRPL